MEQNKPVKCLILLFNPCFSSEESRAVPLIDGFPLHLRAEQ